MPAFSFNKPKIISLVLTIALIGPCAAFPAETDGDSTRGAYIASLGGCVGCHTEDQKGATSFAGGRALKTQFGTFFGPNITPHPLNGIGRWTESDFIRAMREGKRPDGSHYYPVFPYSSFSKINNRDLRDLWAYLRTLPPNEKANRKHEIKFPFSWRSLIAAWKWFFFLPALKSNNSDYAQTPSRGAYLVQALAHCGECHTPRNLLGGLNDSRFLAGGKMPDGKRAPNLTPTRLKQWNDKELNQLFVSGITPDDDTVSEAMSEVVRNTTSKMSTQDLQEMISYLRSLPPLPDEAR